MKIDLNPGAYVVAVSGGVDSMTLLDLMARQPDLQISVAHFDHGIRTDSAEDRQFVAGHAQRLGLPFIYERAELGAHASEAAARKARYVFLHRAREQSGARAIVTAHHQDDVLETMVINMHRGTGRRGLSSLQATSTIERPLLIYTKDELLQYAMERGIAWREDSTNRNQRYLRNYVRRQILVPMSPDIRARLLKIQQRVAILNNRIDSELDGLIAAVSDENGYVVRSMFIMLPHSLAQEVVLALLRRHQVHNQSRQNVMALVIAIKTARPGAAYDIDKSWVLAVTAQKAQIKRRSVRKNS